MTQPPKTRAFVLLEVMVAIIIIGTAAVALMRGFFLSLDSIRRIRMNEQSILLARSLMDDLMLEPPDEGRYEGKFWEDPRFGAPFEGWRWYMEVEAIEPNYDERPRASLFQDLEPLYMAQIVIFHEDANGRREDFLSFDTYLIDPDFFTFEALQQNQLF